MNNNQEINYSDNLYFILKFGKRKIKMYIIDVKKKLLLKSNEREEMNKLIKKYSSSKDPKNAS